MRQDPRRRCILYKIEGFGRTCGEISHEVMAELEPTIAVQRI